MPSFPSKDFSSGKYISQSFQGLVQQHSNYLLDVYGNSIDFLYVTASNSITEYQFSSSFASSSISAAYAINALTASFALKKIKRSQIRKGMVMVSPELKPHACWEFEGEILVLHHPTTISSRYQAMVHCGSIRQTASILTMSKECLRTGDKALVKFRFIKHPEYIRPGQRMVFREGRTKAVGNVLRPLMNAVAVLNRPKPNKMQSRGQQNQSPNVQNSTSKENQQQRQGQGSSKIANTNIGNLEGVLEVSIDKRDHSGNMRSNNTSGINKRTKRVLVVPVGGTSAGQVPNSGTNNSQPSHMAGKVQ